MNEYTINQIFTDTYPPEAAAWCNENRAYIEEIEPQDGVRRFQIVGIPEPTLSEVRTAALSRIDSATSAAILAGFEYEVETGEGAETLHFSYDQFDQSNFNQTANIATLSLSGVEGLPTEITWNGYRNYTPETGGELVRVTLSTTQFLDLYVQGASVHKATQMEIGGQRKAAIEAAESVEEIEALLAEWGV